jgi:hypothetical protein
MKQTKLIELSNNCIKIIKNNSPSKSIHKISVLNDPVSGNNIGIKYALEIYIKYIDYSVEFDKKKFENNVKLYQNLITNNIKEARNEYNKSK